MKWYRILNLASCVRVSFNLMSEKFFKSSTDMVIPWGQWFRKGASFHGKKCFTWHLARPWFHAASMVGWMLFSTISMSARQLLASSTVSETTSILSEIRWHPLGLRKSMELTTDRFWSSLERPGESQEALDGKKKIGSEAHWQCCNFAQSDEGKHIPKSCQIGSMKSGTVLHWARLDKQSKFFPDCFSDKKSLRGSADSRYVELYLVANVQPCSGLKLASTTWACEDKMYRYVSFNGIVVKLPEHKSLW